jgi:anthranilate/para-aminobenzoate synthase component I
VVTADGGCDLAVAIRTLVRRPRGAPLRRWAAAIVWDSDPAREWDELVWKQRAAER